MQLRVDAGLGNRHRLLLHRLVYRRAVILIHLVNLVNARQPPARQHQRPRLKRPAPFAELVAHRRRGEAGRRRGLAGRHHPARRQSRGRPQQLRLGDAGVAHHQHVYVAADAGTIGKMLVDAAEELHRNRLFLPLHAVNRGRYRVDDALAQVGVARQLEDLLHVLLGRHKIFRLRFALVNRVRVEVDVELGPRPSPGILRTRPHHSHDRNPVAGTRLRRE